MSNPLEKLSSKVVSAPMAATTNITFRKLCREFGAAMVFSEMINSDMLVKGCTKTLRRIFFDKDEHPLTLQLFGQDPYVMAEAAKILMKLKPDFIDINAGCPVKKINKLGAGSILLNNLKKLGQIVRAVADSVDVPVSIKIRAGYTHKKIVACEAAKTAEDNGAQFITVHARTRETSYAEKANWEWIKMVKKCVSIPVIGNGDVFKPQNAYEMLDQTGCDYVLIARGALGNPWIFERANHYIKHRELLPEPSYSERLELIIKHYKMTCKENGELAGVREMRKHICWYTRGFPEVEKFRHELFKIDKCTHLDDLVTKYFERLIKGQVIDNGNPEFEEQKFRERVVFWLINIDPDEIVNG
jgi:tRNA-dihydrouridine synthase B